MVGRENWTGKKIQINYKVCFIFLIGAIREAVSVLIEHCSKNKLNGELCVYE